MSHPSAVRSSSPARDRLLAVAELLAVHPSGAVMARLLGTPAPVLRGVIHGTVDELPAGDHLALLAVFAGQVRERLDDGDPEHLAQRLAAWRAWLMRPSLPSPGDAPLRPIDRLADPATVLGAIRDLAAPPVRRGPVVLRLVTVLRPAP